MSQRNLLDVDWSKIPAPSDDGGAANLSLPSLATAVPNASVSGTVSTIALDLVFSNGFE